MKAIAVKASRRMLRQVVPCVTLAVGLVACSGDAQPPPTRAGPPAPMVAPQRDASDLVVAQVNGRPVWGSCVTDQARRGRSRDVALRECVDFELMAQAAEQRGLGTDPGVIDATRTALVSELVAHAYEDGFTALELCRKYYRDAGMDVSQLDLLVR